MENYKSTQRLEENTGKMEDINIFRLFQLRKRQKKANTGL